jgi:hypothetical protein
VSGLLSKQLFVLLQKRFRGSQRKAKAKDSSKQRYAYAELIEISEHFEFAFNAAMATQVVF